MNMRYGTIRKYAQGAGILGFAGAAYIGLPISNCSIKIGEFRLVYPTGVLETMLLNHRLPMELMPGMLLMVVLLLLFGRFYCGWICSAANGHRLAEELIQKDFIKKRTSSLVRQWKSLRNKMSSRLRLGLPDVFAMLVGLIAGIMIFDFPALSIFNPMGVASRSIVEFGVHQRLRADLLLLSVPLLISLCFKSGWKSCCPEGILQGVVARFNQSLIPVVDTAQCNGCTRCQKACPVNIPVGQQIENTQNCQKCLHCIDVCPNQAISLSLIGQKRRSRQTVPGLEPQMLALDFQPIPPNTPARTWGTENGRIIPFTRKQSPKKPEQFSGRANNKVA